MLKQVAEETVEHENWNQTEDVALENAIGRIAGRNHVSVNATPSFDTAATNGFAISSTATANATKNRPVTFVVKGTIAVGDDLPDAPISSGGGIPPCLEIMSGARFPYGTGADGLDACVKVEDVISTVLGSEKMITVVQPVSKYANTRFAGTDFQAGQGILAEGEKIQAMHIMALASAGFSAVTVRRRLRAVVCCIKNEQSKSADPNGLFLVSALRELSVEADLRTVSATDIFAEDFLRQGAYDIVLTLSAGQSLRTTLKAKSARIRFNGVAIRPGHSTLFATLPIHERDIAVLGIPSDALGTVACFRFLIRPFVQAILGTGNDSSKIVRLRSTTENQDLSTCCPTHLDCFRHAWVEKGDRGEEVVVLSPDQSPEKVSHLVASNCWVHVPRGHSGNYRDTLVYCYS